MHHARTGGDPRARHLGAGAGHEGGAARRGPDRRRHRPHGGAELRSRPPAGHPRPHARARAARLGAPTTGACASAPASPTRGSSTSSATACPAWPSPSRTVGSPQIRNRGTVGGNLGTASPAGDGLPPLYVSDAEVELASATGTRRLPVAEFVTGPKRQAAREDELIAAFHLPAATGAAAVRQDRHAQRDGHRRVLALAGHLARAPRGVRVHRLGRPDADPRRRGRGVHRRRARRGGPVGGARADRRRGRWSASASSSRRPRRRSTTSAAAPPTAATRSACSRGAR